MALRKIIQVEGEGIVQTPNGAVTFGPQKTNISAYCKVTNIFANKTNGKATVECTADTYKLVQQYDVPLSVDDGAPNFIKQTYVYLKTLSDWKGATDC
jgi:hypothetical protein